jgi:hypothetical protein
MVTSFSERDSYEKEEFSLTKIEPFCTTDHSIKNTVKCLVDSFELYYKYIEKTKGKLKEGKQPELKDRLYTIYLKTIVNRIQSVDKKETETTCSNYNTEKDLPKEILDALSSQPEFFLKISKMLNFLIFDVGGN